MYEIEASLQRLPGGGDKGSVIWRPERTMMVEHARRYPTGACKMGGFRDEF